MKKNLLLALLSVIVGFALLEGAARLFAGETREPELAFDPACLGDYKPNQKVVAEKSGVRYRVRINGQGYRGHEPGSGAPARVVFLGDSFTFGVSVNDEETFAALLEKADLGGRAIESVNLGVASYGLADELELLREKAPRLSPAVVVLATFVGNDIADELRPASYRSTLAAIWRAPGSPEGARPKAGLIARVRDGSALVRVIQRYVAAPAALHGKTKVGAMAAPLRTLEEMRGRPDFDATVASLWSRYAEHLSAIAAECRVYGWPMIQVLLPTINVADSVASGLDEFARMNAASYRDIARCRAIAASLEIPTVSVAYAMTGDPGVYYNSGGDHHFSPEGHRLVAGLIAGEIREIHARAGAPE